MSQKLNTLALNSQKINLDFSKNKFVSVTVKQYDTNSRYITIQFTNNGEVVKLSSNYTAELRVSTPDNRVIVDNTCSSIQENGTLLLFLTDNVLHELGRVMAEVRLYATEDDNFISLSPMNFYIVVIASPCSEERILSSPDGVTLANLYKQMNADYTHVITEAKTYANLAEESENNAYQSALSSSNSANAANMSQINAKSSETNSKISETNSKTSETNALKSATTATNNATVATNKAKESSDYADLSKSYAVGTDGITREDDLHDNAKYYCDQARIIAQSVTDVVYMGTIPFSELSNVNNQKTNYMFNISEAFVTDDTFRQGIGYSYNAGTNVCRTGDGYWDIMVRITPVETVSDIEPLDQNIGDFWSLEY